ncbi:unnamed protein product [Penicillium viridicatum]
MSKFHKRRLRGPSSPPLTSAVPFSHYLYISRVSRTDTALGFWKDYLAGSYGLTAVPSSTGPVVTNSHSPVNSIQEAIGALAPLSSDITFPTLVNAAIALSLANLTQADDITFVCVMSSRDVLTTAASLGPQQADLLLGPCINRTLLRVQLPEAATNCSALEFCRRLRSDQARVSGEGHLELTDVVENCTDWLRLSPSAASGADQLLKETSFITHLPANTATLSFSLTEDLGVTWESTDVRIHPENQVFVRSTTSTTTDNELHACIQVQASGAVLGEEDAFALATYILETVQLLSAAPKVLVRDILHSGEI